MDKWISVKDKLPEKQEPVLVYVPPYSDENEKYVGYVGVAYYTYSANGGFWGGTDGNMYGAIGIIHEPSYWMPLPKPPEKTLNKEKSELIKTLSEELPDNAYITYAAVTWFDNDDNGVYHWDTNMEEAE